MAEIVETDWTLDPAELMSGLDTDVHLLEPRSPGCHHSDVIRDLENTHIKPGQRKSDIDMSDDDRATMHRYWELGFLWEVVLESYFKKRRIANLDPSKFLRQIEKEHDGVFKTIDAIHIPDWRVLEYKLTFRSMNRATLDKIEMEFWGWFTQLKSNCLAHETRLASLFVFWINGTYHPPVPQTRRYDIIFEEAELVENWHMILTHKKVMEKEGRASWITPKS